MKLKVILITTILLFSFNHSVNAYQLTLRDLKVLNLALYATIDYKQSTTMFYDLPNRKELNPLLGDKPSRESMMIFGAVGVAATYGISKFLPDGTFKNVLIDSILMTEKFNIEENKKTIQYGKRTFNTIMLVMNFNY